MRYTFQLKALLVFTTFCYPAAHYALHRVAATDPWTLGGWAMYTVPRPKLAIFVPHEKKALDASALCPNETVDYVSWRMAVGHFAGDGSLRRCLEGRGLRGKELWLLQRRFDGASGRFLTTKSQLGAPL